MPAFFSCVELAGGGVAVDLALITPGFSGGVLHDLLLVGRQRVPDLLAEDQRLRVVLVVGQRQVLLHFGELVGQDHRQRVLLPVDGLAFQAGVDLGEGHRRGVGTQRLDPVDVDGVGDHAQLQAGDVFHRVDGRLLLVMLRKPSSQ
jgi:hypothetical protein